MRGKIYNIVTIPGIIIGTIVIYNNAEFDELLIRIITSFVVFAVLFVLFAIGMIGAGDIKLLMMMSIYLSFEIFYIIVFYSFIIALIYSIYILWRKKLIIGRLTYFMEYVMKYLSTGRMEVYENRSDKKISVRLAIPIFLVYVVWYVLNM